MKPPSNRALEFCLWLIVAALAVCLALLLYLELK